MEVKLKEFRENLSSQTLRTPTSHLLVSLRNTISCSFVWPSCFSVLLLSFFFIGKVILLRSNSLFWRTIFKRPFLQTHEKQNKSVYDYYFCHTFGRQRKHLTFVSSLSVSLRLTLDFFVLPTEKHLFEKGFHHLFWDGFHLLLHSGFTYKWSTEAV